MKTLLLLFIVLSGLGGYFGWYKPQQEAKKLQLEAIKTIILSSPAFEDGENIPIRYTCIGEDVNPPLTLSSVPPETESLAIVLDDLSEIGGFTHWLVWNIDPAVKKIEEGSIPKDGTEGRNGFKNDGWGGPCPTLNQEHRYRFTVYALDRVLNLNQGVGRSMFDKEIHGKVIAIGRLTGKFSRTKVDQPVDQPADQ